MGVSWISNSLSVQALEMGLPASSASLADCNA